MHLCQVLDLLRRIKMFQGSSVSLSGLRSVMRDQDVSEGAVCL